MADVPRGEYAAVAQAEPEPAPAKSRVRNPGRFYGRWTANPLHIHRDCSAVGMCCCCPCVLWARIARKSGVGRAHSYGLLLAGFTALFLLLVFSKAIGGRWLRVAAIVLVLAVALALRRAVRRALAIQETRYEDVLFAVCCPLLGFTQMARHLFVNESVNDLPTDFGDPGVLPPPASVGPGTGVLVPAGDVAGEVAGVDDVDDVDIEVGRAEAPRKMRVVTASSASAGEEDSSGDGGGAGAEAELEEKKPPARSSRHHSIRVVTATSVEDDD